MVSVGGSSAEAVGLIYARFINVFVSIPCSQKSMSPLSARAPRASVRRGHWKIPVSR